MLRPLLLPKKFSRWFDERFHTNLTGILKWLRDSWYANSILNALRRFAFRTMQHLRLLFGLPSRHYRLHLGCGNRHLEGYLNIDWRKTLATDAVCDIRHLPYPPNSVDRIEIYHVIEHLSRNDFERALTNWHRILHDKGTLVIECPDFDSAVREYLSGNEDRMNNIFGWQRFDGDAHRYGYNFRRLERTLVACGFSQIRQEEPQDYHRDEEPCIRVVCLKEV